jgi:4-hydroxy-3-polyprenylbenzoate decarboxylase
MDETVRTVSDLRDFLESLEAVGELHRIDAEVDPVLELGAIAQRLAERGGPAVHFTNVTGAAHGVTWTSGILGRGSLGLWSKFAVALGRNAKAEYREVLEEVTRRQESSVRPLQVSGGQCKAVILRGSDIDLGSLGAPTLHESDGGPCLTSWAFTVAADPDSNYVAWDLLPLMVQSENTLAGQLNRDTNVGRLWLDKYRKAAQPMPVAIVFGAGPMATAAAALRRGRTRITDPEIAGALQRSPVQLVKCETNGLLVPAGAEMVLEGVVHPDKLTQCGPFGSSFGYRDAKTVDAPIFEIHAITHRENPILPCCAWGTPTNDLHIVQGLDRDSQLKAKFENAGAPVVDVFSPPWLAGAVVAASTQVPYTAYAQSVAGVIRTTEATKNTPYILVCDDDIDITNPVSLFHALVTKCHPKRDTWLIQQAEAAADAPYLTPHDRQLGCSARAIFDCTWPLDWDRSIAVPPKVSFDQCYPKALQEKVLSEWVTTLGFPPENERPV